MIYLIIAEAVLVIFVMGLVTNSMMEMKQKVTMLQAFVTWIIAVVVVSAVLNLVLAIGIITVGSTIGLTSSVAMTVYSLMQ